MRSDHFPEREATTAITSGCAMRTIPASRGDMPWMYCRYRLSTKVTAKVVA
jgi:hypothetical protein